MVFEDHCDQSNAVKCFAFDFWLGAKLQLRIELLALLASEHAFSRDVFEMSNEIVIRKKRERAGKQTSHRLPAVVDLVRVLFLHLHVLMCGTCLM